MDIGFIGLGSATEARTPSGCESGLTTAIKPIEKAAGMVGGTKGGVTGK
jgi:hypothetical protein